MDAKLIGATGRMRVSRPHLTHYRSYILRMENIRQSTFIYSNKIVIKIACKVYAILRQQQSN